MWWSFEGFFGGFFFVLFFFASASSCAFFAFGTVTCVGKLCHSCFFPLPNWCLTQGEGCIVLFLPLPHIAHFLWFVDATEFVCLCAVPYFWAVHVCQHVIFLPDLAGVFFLFVCFFRDLSAAMVLFVLETEI